MAEQHETVGRYFRGPSGVSVCTRFQQNLGFWMRVVEPDPDPLIKRAIGEEANVSPGAIYRTYHPVRQGPLAERVEAHETPCDCYICQPKPDPEES